MLKKSRLRFFFALLCLSNKSNAFELSLFPYLFEQGFKQGSILLRARPVKEVLMDPKTSEELRLHLILSQRVLEFASKELGLKTGNAYTKYYDLKRPWLTQIVMAAKADMIEPYEFDYPVIGKMPYKGFFEEADAIRLENDLSKQGYDTYRRGAAAFSSLGWFDDPLLSSMMGDEADLAELLIHELTHRTIFFDGDADYNEALASYVGYVGALKMIEMHPAYFKTPLESKKKLELDFERNIKVAIELSEFIEMKNKELNAFTTKEEKLRHKQLILKALPQTLSQLKMLGANEWNFAKLLAISTYNKLLPALKEKCKILEKCLSAN